MTTAATLFQMMRTIRELTETLAETAPSELASPDLTLEHAERLLDFCVRFVAGVERLYGAIDELGSNDSASQIILMNSLSFADLSHCFGSTLLMVAREQVRRLGGNPDRIVCEAQRRYH